MNPNEEKLFLEYRKAVNELSTAEGWTEVEAALHKVKLILNNPLLAKDKVNDLELKSAQILWKASARIYESNQKELRH